MAQVEAAKPWFATPVVEGLAPNHLFKKEPRPFFSKIVPCSSLPPPRLDLPLQVAMLPRYQMSRQYGGSESKVKYLSHIELSKYELSVRNGLFYDAKNRLYNSGQRVLCFGHHDSIFVISPQGRIYACRHAVPGRFHHSSFLQGRPVATAGEVIIKQGRLKAISYMSGHYQPNTHHFNQGLNFLKNQGVSMQSVNVLR